MKLYDIDTIVLDQSDGYSRFFDFHDVIAVLRRQWRVLTAAMVVSLGLGLLYLATAVPFYTSSSIVVLDEDGNLREEQRSADDVDWARKDPTRNSPYIVTQMQLFRSNVLVDRVIDKLGLLDNEAFMASNRSLFASAMNIGGFLLSHLGFIPDGSKEAEASQRRNAARQGLLTGLQVTRIGESSALNISYLSTSPALSAEIVNAFGDAYTTDLLSARYESTRRASDWLQERIGELREKAVSADLAVQKFRGEHNLLTAQDKKTEESTLISGRQLQELNTALMSANADAAFSRAQYEAIKKAIDAGQVNAEASGTIGRFLSNELRTSYLDAVRLEADLSRRLGADNEQAVRQRRSVEQYSALMFDELKRVAESYYSEMKIADTRAANIAESVAKASITTSIADQDQVQMRELEREAETSRRLYEAFLFSYQSSNQQQSVPVLKSRVVTVGRPADAPTHPVPALIMGLCFMVGLLGGSAACSWRESRDLFFRTGDDVEEKLGLTFLGNVPLLKAPGEGSGPIADYVVDHSFSAFAETLRSTKIAIDLALPRQSAKTIGIVSTLPGEGKSTVAVNLANLLADVGKRVVLIDGDLRNPGATRLLTPRAERGILDVLLGRSSLESAFVEHRPGGFRFLPAVSRHRVPQSADLLSSAEMRQLLADASATADYILVDLPPVGPVVDARAMADLVDGFLYVVEWGKVSRKAVTRVLSDEPLILEKCLGVILSKVDPRGVKLYQEPDAVAGARPERR